MTTINPESPALTPVSPPPQPTSAPQGENLPESGQKVPSRTSGRGESNPPEKNPLSSKRLEKAVRELNDYVKTFDRTLHFSVDSNLHRTVITVVNAETGEIIRQIPPEKMLTMARHMETAMSTLLDVLA